MVLWDTRGVTRGVAEGGISVLGEKTCPNLLSNIVRGGGAHGVLFSDSSSGLFAVLFGEPLTPHNLSRVLPTFGLSFSFFEVVERLHFQENDVSECATAGVVLSHKAFPTVRKNKIHKCVGEGILVSDEATGLFEENESRENSSEGLTVRTAGAPVCKGNKFHRNKSHGTAFGPVSAIPKIPPPGPDKKVCE